MAVAWYPRATNTSRAASSSCRRRSCRGRRLPRGLVSDVAVKVRSPGGCAALFFVRPHPKSLSTVIVIVEADRDLLLGQIRLIHVQREFVPGAGGVLVRDDFLVLLDGVVLGRFQVQFAHRCEPLFFLVGSSRRARCPRQLSECCLHSFPVGGESMHDIG